jgi:TolA-binding protein
MRTSVLVVAFTLSTVPAKAAAPVRHAKPETAIDILPAARVAPPAPRAREAPTGPRLTVEEFVGLQKQKLAQLNLAAIDKHERLLRITSDEDAEKPDLLFRLAELCAEQMRFYRSLARGLDQKVHEASGAGKAALTTQQQGHEQEEARWRLRAVESYAASARFPRYQRMDEVLFSLASLVGAEHQVEARELFHRLIREYPRSRYIPDAYLAFAQFYFEQGEMNAARRFYEKVASFPRARLRGYALYKRVW